MTICCKLYIAICCKRYIAGPDHLVYFALMGRIAGLALYHRERLNAPWSSAFLKAVFGFTITCKDVESVDPELYDKRIVYLQDRLYKTRDHMSLDQLGLTFVDDSNDLAVVYETPEEHRPVVELKPGGAELAVTEENREEYLQLFAQYRLIHEIREQISAFQEGLGVFVDEDLRSTLCRCCTVSDIQLLLCGVGDVDVDDWEVSSRCTGGLTAASDLVRWFWALVREMSTEERSKLLLFCTGSARAPATGFGTLMGYSGQQQPFTLQGMPCDPAQLPTAATCFNTLRLPSYTSAAVLRTKLRQALNGAVGFDERAVAV